MLALTLLAALAVLLIVYLFMPALWLAILAVDESLEPHESGLAVVASRSSLFFLISRVSLTSTNR